VLKSLIKARGSSPRAEGAAGIIAYASDGVNRKKHPTYRQDDIL
jgi:hypothetical protein